MYLFSLYYYKSLISTSNIKHIQATLIDALFIKLVVNLF